MHQSPGFFLTFEGPDGAGKTTQLRRLTEWLRSRGLDPVTLRQPGGTALGERLRGVLLDSRASSDGLKVAPLAELALMFGDRAQSIAEVIRPALDAGRVVLCDRYTDSSEAYQGGGRRLGVERVLTLHRALCDDLQPDLTILLLPDLEAALERAEKRNRRFQQKHGGADENRFEAEGEQFFRRVYEAYRQIAAREPERVAVVDGDGDIESVEERVRTVVLQRLRRAAIAV